MASQWKPRRATARRPVGQRFRLAFLFARLFPLTLPNGTALGRAPASQATPPTPSCIGLTLKQRRCETCGAQEKSAPSTGAGASFAQRRRVSRLALRLLCLFAAALELAEDADDELFGVAGQKAPDEELAQVRDGRRPRAQERVHQAFGFGDLRGERKSGEEIGSEQPGAAAA